MKNKAPFQKNLEKLETVVNICVLLIKQHQKKIAEILPKHFLTWSIQNFVRKVQKSVLENIIVLDQLTWLTNYDIGKFLISFYAVCY